ncbi:MAG: biotin/lipoyl-binding protein, partial [Actinomycetota bacterium]|nr:biotin/lipoyl-binding protein [Actinomycetota bacterium]
EIQVAVDGDGNGVALGERECSLQRRYQKLIEESPSPVIDPSRRERLEEAAVALALEAGYRNLGTVEFLVDSDRPDDFFFLEMNARLQVEHPVTELVTGLDLVEMQVAIANGDPISGFDTGRRQGHAIEARICAERPTAGFLPATGKVLSYSEPEGVRCDSGIEAGSSITTDFDPMLMKVIAHGEDREQAIERLASGLAGLTILGVETNADYLRRLVTHPRVMAGETTTSLVESASMKPEAPDPVRTVAAAGAVLASRASGSGPGFDRHDAWRVAVPGTSHWTLVDGEAARFQVSVAESDCLTVSVDGETVQSGRPNREAPDAIRFGGATWRYALDGAELWISGPDGVARFDTEPRLSQAGSVADALVAQLPGTVLSVEVAEGDVVKEGDVLVVIESMKMEITVAATEDGTVVELPVAPGDHVERGRKLATIEGVDA